MSNLEQQMTEATMRELGITGRTPAKVARAVRANIALVRDALLSDAAVRALTRALVDIGNERAGIDDDVWPDDYSDEHVVAMMDESLHGITAALDAALGTEADDE